MELREYVRAVRRRWPWILVPLLLALAVTAGLTMARPPAYRSTMVLFVSAAEAGDPDVVSSRLNSYVALITGPRVAQAVVSQLGLPVPADEIQQQLTAEVQPGTELLVVTATDPSAQRSRNIVTTAAATFIALAQELDPPRGVNQRPSVSITVAQDAVTAPVPRRLGRNLGFAAVLGLLVGAAAVAGRELVRRTVGEERDLLRLGLSPISVISFDGRAGRPGRMRYPDDALAEAFRRLRATLPTGPTPPDDGGRGRSLLLTASVPDEGSTAVACGLAIAEAEAGANVVLVDANLRDPGIGRYLAMDTTRGLADVLAGSVDAPDVLQDCLGGRLAVLPAGFPRTDPGELLASPVLGGTIDYLRNRFDIVLIDAPPVQSAADAAVLGKQTDGVLLVVRAGHTRMAEVERSVDLLRRVGTQLLGAVLNALPRRLSGPGSWSRDAPLPPWQPSAAPALPARSVPGPDGPIQPPMTGAGGPARPGGPGWFAGSGTPEPGPGAAGGPPPPVRGQARVVDTAREPADVADAPVDGSPGPAPRRVVDLTATARGQARVVTITDAGTQSTGAGMPTDGGRPTGADGPRMPGQQVNHDPPTAAVPHADVPAPRNPEREQRHGE